jgi:transcription initiation factor TFIID subunit 1
MEIARLKRNKERRLAREKQKGRQSTIEPKEENTGSPSATPAQTIEKPVGTARKCANCGQVGHIKTNKKYCPNCE